MFETGKYSLNSCDLEKWVTVIGMKALSTATDVTSMQGFKYLAVSASDKTPTLHRQEILRLPPLDEGESYSKHVVNDRVYIFSKHNSLSSTG